MYTIIIHNDPILNIDICFVYFKLKNSSNVEYFINYVFIFRSLCYYFYNATCLLFEYILK